MNTENKTTRTAENTGANSRIAFDPEELWLDQDIEPEELIRIDPLDITDMMVEVAENPELADPVLRRLPK
jgi:hypothetical protein